MLFSKNLLLGTYLAASSGLVSAHYMVTNMFINGVDQGPGKCMRIPPNTNPVTNINSNDMSCSKLRIQDETFDPPVGAS